MTTSRKALMIASIATLAASLPFAIAGRYDVANPIAFVGLILAILA